jgi:hypothetical protein
MARNRWLRVRPRLLLAAAADAVTDVAAVDVDSGDDDADAGAVAALALCRLRTLLLLLPVAVVAVVTVLAVVILPRLPCVVRLLAEDGLPFISRCGGDVAVVDADGKDKDGDADSAAEEYVALVRRLCFEDAADVVVAKEPRDPLKIVDESPSSSSSPCSLTA